MSSLLVCYNYNPSYQMNIILEALDYPKYISQYPQDKQEEAELTYLNIQAINSCIPTEIINIDEYNNYISKIADNLTTKQWSQQICVFIFNIRDFKQYIHVY